MNLKPEKITLIAVFALACGLLIWWFFYNPVHHFTLSTPGMDNRKKGVVAAKPVLIGAEFRLTRQAPDVPGTRWPGFRGPDRDNISKEQVPLREKWDAGGPKILWKVKLGEGHAAPAVFDGKVYLLDYDETNKSDQLRCLLLSTGEELWRRGYRVHLKRNHGLSRTIPAVNSKFVVSMGPKCQLMCADRENGNYLWGVDLAKDYSTEIPFWYTGQCPLLDGDTVIVAPGGKALLVAYDCRSGKKIWETPNPRRWNMSHSSIMPMELNGKKMVVYFAIGGLFGVSVSGGDRGKVLWESSEFAPSVIAPSPVVLDEGRIFITAGYGAGSALLQVIPRNGSYEVRVLQRFKPQEGLASEQQTPIFLNGYLYGIQPKDAGSSRNQFVCTRSDNCKKIVMTSGKTDRFGLGPYLYADGKFYILNDDGELTIARCTPSQFTVTDKTRIIDGQDSWGPMVITGGYMLMRDARQMVCLDLKKP